jgi:L-lysine exporter family protein LysE/ArgO
MLASYLQGLILMATLIMPIGMQNAFVLNQGVKRQHHLLVAALCSLFDALFMLLAVYGGAWVMNLDATLLQVMGLLGGAFMFWYAAQCFKRAWKPETVQYQAKSVGGRSAAIAATFAFTLLNPHVYLDTLVILGGFAAHIPLSDRLGFVVGATSASMMWFFSLALLGARLAPWLSRPAVRRVQDLVFGLMIASLGIYLLYGMI